MNRKQAAMCSQQTMEILQQNGYYNSSKQWIDLTDWLSYSVEKTISYPSDTTIENTKTFDHQKDYPILADQIIVENITTLDAAKKMVSMGYKTVALNFASAKNPGGGFLGGSRAQEESIARASGLYLTIKDNPMYDMHRNQRDPMYSDYMIYSPQVPVFRNDNGKLLDKPFLSSFITAPAVNAGVVLSRSPSKKPKIALEMEKRIEKVLTIAAIHNYQAIVLGAWGCGVFRNDPSSIAQLFHQALYEKFPQSFHKVFFAVFDTSKNQKFITPFQKMW